MAGEYQISYYNNPGGELIGTMSASSTTNGGDIRDYFGLLDMNFMKLYMLDHSNNQYDQIGNRIDTFYSTVDEIAEAFNINMASDDFVLYNSSESEVQRTISINGSVPKQIIINNQNARCVMFNCVKVRPDDSTPITSISISPSTLRFEETGKTAALSVSVSPSGATSTIYWSSSNTSVATVSQSGVVTSRGKGTATITVTTSNGLSATATVNVVLEYSGIEITLVGGGGGGGGGLSYCAYEQGSGYGTRRSYCDKGCLGGGGGGGGGVCIEPNACLETGTQYYICVGCGGSGGSGCSKSCNYHGQICYISGWSGCDGTRSCMNTTAHNSIYACGGCGGKGGCSNTTYGGKSGCPQACYCSGTSASLVSSTTCCGSYTDSLGNKYDCCLGTSLRCSGGGGGGGAGGDARGYSTGIPGVGGSACCGYGGGGDGGTYGRNNGCSGTGCGGGGGGGGGCGCKGSNGKGGIVVVKYPTSCGYYMYGGSKSTSGSYTYHCFTSSGTLCVGEKYK